MKSKMRDLQDQPVEPVLAAIECFFEVDEIQHSGNNGVVVSIEVVNRGAVSVSILNPFRMVSSRCGMTQAVRWSCRRVHCRCSSTMQEAKTGRGTVHQRLLRWPGMGGRWRLLSSGFERCRSIVRM